jgi:hypothetical protein
MLAAIVYCYIPGTQTCRFILNNYATTDSMASLCRAAIGASIVFGYPLTFITAREGILSALNIQEPSDTQVNRLYATTFTTELSSAVVLQ